MKALKPMPKEEKETIEEILACAQHGIPTKFLGAVINGERKLTGVLEFVEACRDYAALEHEQPAAAKGLLQLLLKNEFLKTLDEETVLRCLAKGRSKIRKVVYG